MAENVTLNFRIPRKIWEEIKILGEEMDRSGSAQLVSILKGALKDAQDRKEREKLTSAGLLVSEFLCEDECKALCEHWKKENKRPGAGMPKYREWKEDYDKYRLSVGMQDWDIQPGPVGE